MYIFPPDMKSAKLAARGVEKGKQGRILNFRYVERRGVRYQKLYNI